MTDALEQLPPLALSWAKFGDVVEPANMAGHREKHFVMHGCLVVSKGYYCATCDVHLANVGNLVMHIDRGGAHHIAIWCSKHRVYECADASQIEGFQKLQAVSP